MRFFFYFLCGSVFVFCSGSAFAEGCYVVLAYKGNTGGPAGPTSLYSGCTANFEQNNFSCSGPDQYPAGTQWVNWDARIYMYNDQHHTWQGRTAISKSLTTDGQIKHDAMCDSPDFQACIAAKYPSGCPAANPCEAKRGQPGPTIYVGMPRDSAYYEIGGVCDDGCTVKPARGVTLDSYASDGSGYIIGPWTYTGDQCQEGITETPPPQPPPENQCEALTNACQAKCAGRPFQQDCDTGDCECFGAPSYTADPPLDPTVPTADPGSPPVPGAQTPTTDPGGDAQLGAQISNQGKQLAQGDAQLGQLGAINNKLSAVISNQGKQLGQGDKMLDYGRRQLGVQEDIRNKLAKMTEGDAPSLPDQPELDGTIPDVKNWAEYDDAGAIGQAQGQKQIDIIEGAQSDSPFTFGIDTSGSDPCLSGPLLGTQIDICFNRPWMLTGYAIMQSITISVGYLQAFLMIQKVVTGA